MEIRTNEDVAADFNPSWLDQLTNAVDGLPLPVWVSYGLVAGLLTLIFVGVQATQGAYSQSGFFGWHIFFALQPLFPIVAVHYLDVVAQEAIERFRKSFSGNEVEFQAARERLTTMPARAALLAGLTGMILSLILFSLLQDLDTSYELARVADTLLANGIFLLYILVAWFGFGVWVLHTIRQLVEINRLYTRQAVVDPLHPQPLYALSSITSRTAIFILLNTYGWFGANTSSGFANYRALISLILTNVFFIALGLLIFVWPLWGAHKLLEDAKGAALAVNAVHFQTAVSELHRRVESKELGQMDGWEKALSALHIERAQLERLATWPWAPGALRNFMLALVVPILVWFAQFGLQRILE